jgi:hypothetical protein
LWELWTFEDSMSNLVFWSYFFCLNFLDLQLWDFINHEGLHMWDKFNVIYMCIERDRSI